MANNRRRAERRKEIEQLVHDGRLANRTGKSRSSVPFKPFESMNGMHWLKGWDMEEQERLNALERARLDEHGRLLAGIDIFEQTGARVTLVSVLRVIAERLPPVTEGLTSEDYEAIHGWGGQG